MDTVNLLSYLDLVQRFGWSQYRKLSLCGSLRTAVVDREDCAQEAAAVLVALNRRDVAVHTMPEAFLHRCVVNRFHDLQCQHPELYAMHAAPFTVTLDAPFKDDDNALSPSWNSAEDFEDDGDLLAEIEALETFRTFFDSLAPHEQLLLRLRLAGADKKQCAVYFSAHVPGVNGQKKGKPRAWDACDINRLLRELLERYHETLGTAPAKPSKRRTRRRRVARTPVP